LLGNTDTARKVSYFRREGLASDCHRFHERIERQPRSAAALLSAVGRGADIGYVSLREAADLRRHTRKSADRFERDITRALERRDLRRAKNLTRKMMASASARLWALLEAYRSVPVNMRPPMAELVQSSRDVDVYRRQAHPKFHTIRKPEGGIRPIYIFGPEDQACAILIAAALKPFARTHPTRACHSAQTLLAGGTPTACENLHDALKAAPVGAYFVHVDVKAFYRAIAVGMLAGVTGLDPRVIQRHLSVKRRRPWEKDRLTDLSLMEMVVTRREGSDRQSDDGGGERPANGETAPAEVPTGSAAASIVAEVVMAAVLRDVGALPEALCTIAYSDNIGVLAPSREAAEAIKAALLGILGTHRLGPFSPSRATVEPVDRWFNFLGYRWRAQARVVSVEPNQRRHERWQITTIAKAMDGSIEDLNACIASLRSYCGSFPLWAGRGEFETHLGGELRVMRSRLTWELARRSGPSRHACAPDFAPGTWR
jgi:hypothetical protein